MNIYPQQSASIRNKKEPSNTCLDFAKLAILNIPKTHFRSTKHAFSQVLCSKQIPNRPPSLEALTADPTALPDADAVEAVEATGHEALVELVLPDKSPAPA